MHRHCCQSVSKVASCPEISTQLGAGVAFMQGTHDSCSLIIDLDEKGQYVVPELINN